MIKLGEEIKVLKIEWIGGSGGERGGGGVGMGNTCKPMAVSFQCMTKSTTIKKIIIIKEK